MGVLVYSQLGDALRTRNLTVDDLQGQIAACFDLAVRTRTLDRLARDERVRRPNIEIVAAAAVLGVGLKVMPPICLLQFHEIGPRTGVIALHLVDAPDEQPRPR